MREAAARRTYLPCDVFYAPPRRYLIRVTVDPVFVDSVVRQAPSRLMQYVAL